MKNLGLKNILATVSTLLSSGACGGVVDLSYDLMNRVTRIEYPNGYTIEYSYDAAGNRLAYAATAISVTSSEGSNGTISPSGAQTVARGSSLVLTGMPSAGFAVDTWTVDGVPVQRGGAAFALIDIQGNRNVSVTFKPIVPNGFDETINFAGNLMPAGWTLSGNNGRIANDRFEARETDTWAYLTKAMTLPAGTVALEICYTGNTVDAYWGQGTSANLQLADGRRFTGALGKADGDGEPLKATFGAEANSEQRVITPPEFSTFRFYLLYQDGGMFYRINRSLDVTGTAAPLLAATRELPGFSLADVREIEFFSGVTTGPTSWVDDIEIRAFQRTENLAVSHFTLLPDRSALVQWPSLPGRKYRIEASPTLANPGWSVVGPNPWIASDRASAFQVEPTPDNKRFFRIWQDWP